MKGIPRYDFVFSVEIQDIFGYSAVAPTALQALYMPRSVSETSVFFGCDRSKCLSNVEKSHRSYL